MNDRYFIKFNIKYIHVNKLSKKANRTNKFLIWLQKSKKQNDFVIFESIVIFLLLRVQFSYYTRIVLYVCENVWKK